MDQYPSPSASKAPRFVVKWCLLQQALSTRRPHSERGAFAVVATLLIPVIVGICALTVDIANGRQRKSQAQATADAAALAAAQDLPTLANVVTTAKAFVAKNIEVPTSAWTNCQDPSKLDTMPDSGIGNQCISVSSDLRRVRVRIPTIKEKTFFGGLIGQSFMGVSAAAIASAKTLGSDRIVPAAVTNLSGKGRVCIEQSSGGGGGSSGCPFSTKGTFGSLFSPRMNRFVPSSGSVSQDTLAINYAIGVDHPLVAYTGAAKICDGAIITPCASTNQGTALSANHLNIMTGNNVPPVTEGFVAGMSVPTTDAGTVAFCGRFTRPDVTDVNVSQAKPENCTNPGSPRISLLGKTINGRHIYHWLTDSARSFFYPEVTAYDPSNPSFAIGNIVYSAGDARLDCFLKGYAYNAATNTETLPVCAGVTYPGTTTTWSATTADSLRYVTGTFSGSTGTAPWATPWSEVTDDGSPSGGNFFQAGSASNPIYMMKPLTGALGQYMVRTASLRHSNGVDLANSASLSFSMTNVNPNTGRIALEISTNGTLWSRLEEYTGATTLGTKLYNITPFISPTTQIRLVVTAVTSHNPANFQFGDVTFTYSGTIAAPPTGRFGPIFKVGFMNDMRWGAVPRIIDFSKTVVPIDGFWGCYFYNSYTNSTKILGVDAWVFDLSLMQVDPSTSGFSYGFEAQPSVQLNG